MGGKPSNELGCKRIPGSPARGSCGRGCRLEEGPGELAQAWGELDSPALPDKEGGSNERTLAAAEGEGLGAGGGQQGRAGTLEAVLPQLEHVGPVGGGQRAAGGLPG